MRLRCVLSVCGLLGAVLGSPRHVAADVIVLNESRYITGSASTAANYLDFDPDNDTFSFDNFDEFPTTAGAPWTVTQDAIAETGLAAATGIASQTSDAGALTFSGTGSASATSEGAEFDETFGYALSFYSQTIQLTSHYSFDYSALVDAVFSGDYQNADASAFIRDGSGFVLLSFIDANAFFAGQSTDSEAALLSGTLTPGVYEIVAFAQAFTGTPSTGYGPAAGSSNFNVSLTLTPAVVTPEPSSISLFGIGMGMAHLWRKRSRQADNDRS
jgi:hypothetical protein